MGAKPDPGDRSPAPSTGKKMSELDSLKKVGKYEIQRKIGAGGMGAVFLALDTQLKRSVALKVLPSDKAQNPTLLRRFHAEAQAVATLKHDNIVTVYEAGTAEGLNFMALEFIDGTDVSDLVLRRGNVPVKRSIEIIKQVARALQHAQSHSIVHRDIKPANLLIRRDGVVKLADMGLARSLDETADTGITRAGTTVGTVDYMAPEQARDSKAADVRSDIYSLGCTWYYMLTGSPPFPEGSLTNKLRAHAETPPPDPRLKNPNVPEGVVAIIHRMLAKSPQQRYQTPLELIEDLQKSMLNRDAVSESVMSELARDQAEPVHAGERTKGGAAGDTSYSGGERTKASGPMKPPPREDSLGNEPVDPNPLAKQRDMQPRIYLAVGLVLIGAVAGLGYVTQGFSTVFVSPTTEGANPFARPDMQPPVTGSGNGQGSNPGNQDPRPGDNPPGETKTATDEHPKPPDGTQPKPTDPAQTKVAKTGENSSTGTKSATPGTTPSATDPRPEDKLLPAWAVARRPAEGLKTFVVRANGHSKTEYANLNDALDQATGNGAIITLADKGPFVLRPIQLRDRGHIIIRSQGAAAPTDPAPLIVLVAPDKVDGGLLRLVGTTLDMHDVNLAFDATELKKNDPFSLIQISNSSFYFQNGNISVKGNSTTPFTAIKFDGKLTGPESTVTGGASRLLLDRVVIRGSNLSALKIATEAADVVVRNSLIWSGTAPGIVLEGTSATKSDILRQVLLFGSTLCSHRNALQIAGDTENQIRTGISVVNSIVAAPTGSDQATLVTLQKWTHSQALGNCGRILTWNSVNGLYLGWAKLVNILPEGLPIAKTFADWERLWKQKNSGESVQFQATSWPRDLAAETANLKLADFDPKSIGRQFVKTADGRWPGCDPSVLSIASFDTLKKGSELAARPQLPSGLFAGTAITQTLHVDLNNQDFGKWLTTQKLTNGTVIVATGTGARLSSPIAIQDAWVRMRFDQKEGHPLVLLPRSNEANRSSGKGARDDAFVTVTNGGLEIENGMFAVASSDRPATPKWMIQVVDGDLALRHCRVQGPMVVNNRNRGVIQWLRTETATTPARPFPGAAQGYFAVIDSYLSGSGIIVEADLRQRAMFFRNSVVAAREDLFKFDLQGSDPAIAATVDIDHCTFSAAGTYYHIEAGILPGPTETPLAIFNDSCVFAPPIKTGTKSPNPTLLAYSGPMLDQKQMTWGEAHNGYAPDVVFFLRSAADDLNGAAQAFDRVWLQQWGADRVIQPLTGAGGVTLKSDLPPRSKVELSHFQLNQNSKASLWGDGQKQIGANIGSINLPEIKTTPVPPTKSKNPKASAPKPGF